MKKCVSVIAAISSLLFVSACSLDVNIQRSEDLTGVLVEAPFPPQLKPYNEKYSLAGDATSIVFDHQYRQLVFGSFEGYFETETQMGDIAILNSDFTPVSSFKVGKKLTSLSQTQAIGHNVVKVQPTADGIVIAGTFNSVEGTQVKGLAKLDMNGNLAHTFPNPNRSTGYDATLQADGKVLISESSTGCTPICTPLRRFNVDGTEDTAFKSNVDVLAVHSVGRILLNPDQSILISPRPGNVPTIMKLFPDGTRDNSFVPPVFSSNNQNILSYATNGSDIFVAGYFDLNGTHRNIIKLDSSGALVSGFNNGLARMQPQFNGHVTNIELLHNGNLLATGLLETVDGVSVKGLAILDPATGANVAGFTLDAAITKVYAAAQNSQNNLIVGGIVKNLLNEDEVTVVEIDLTGAIIRRSGLNFTGPGVVQEYRTIRSITIGDQDQIYISGSFYNTSYVKQPRLIRFKLTGEVDTSFQQGTGFNGAVNEVVVTKSGRYIVSGDFTEYNGEAISRLAVLNEDGSLDKSGTGAGLDIPAHAVLDIESLDKGGAKFLVMTSVVSPQYNGTAVTTIFAIDETGALDAGFNGNIDAGFNFTMTNLKKLSGQHIYVSMGAATTYQGQSVGKFFRLNLDGTLDSTFSTLAAGVSIIDGYVDEAVVELSDGRVLVTGTIDKCQGVDSWKVLILSATGGCSKTYGTRFDPYMGNAWTVQAGANGTAMVSTSYPESDNGQVLDQVFKINADGELDSSYYRTNSFVDDDGNGVEILSAKDPQGRFYLYGKFTKYQGQTSRSFIWMNSDMSVRSLKTTQNAQNFVTGAVCRIDRCVFSFSW